MKKKLNVLSKALPWLGVILLHCVVFSLGLSLAPHFGITYDEIVHQLYGHFVYWYFRDGYQDALSLGDIYRYGALVDYFIYKFHFEKFKHIFNYDFRHYGNFVFGYVGIIFISMFGKKVAGWGGFLISLILILLSPSYIGHLYNNPKDIPFSSFFIGTLYFLIQLRPGFPYLSLRIFVGLIVSISLALNVRVGAILLMIYFFSYWLLQPILEGYQEKSYKKLMRLIPIAFFCLCLIPLFLYLGTYFWPWGQLDFFRNPFIALSSFSSHSVNGEMLYLGEMVRMDRLPWHYIPIWIFYTTPVIAVFGFMLGLIFVRNHFKTFILLALSIVLPISVAIIKQTSLYDGYRHFIFVYPVLIVLSTLGWCACYKFVINRFGNKLKPVFIVLFFALCIEPINFHIKHFPNQTTYFSPLVGGVKGTFGKMDQDYWGNCYKQATDWILQKHLDYQGPAVTIGLERAALIPDAYLQRDARFILKRNETNVDYFLHFMRGSPRYLKAITELPNILFQVEVDGAPLCVISGGGFNKEILSY